MDPLVYGLGLSGRFSLRHGELLEASKIQGVCQPLVPRRLRMSDFLKVIRNPHERYRRGAQLSFLLSPTIVHLLSLAICCV